MRPDDFELISALVKKRSGLMLSKDKVYLVESRLGPVARRHGLSNIEELVRKLRLNPPETLIVEITEAMMTNESFFFRDKTPFDLFTNDILPELLRTRATQKSFRIWCAAAATGQEPYSLAMILRDKAAQLEGWRVEILATDISTEVLTRAKAGKYSQFEVQRGLPIQMLVKNFAKSDDRWQIDPALRDMIRFRQFNLLDDFAPLGRFDVVFCRNVLIYFDQPTKRDVLERIAKQLPAEGLLLLGAAETVIGTTEALRPVNGKRGLYELAKSPSSQAAFAQVASA